jgi:hypothetical protein
MDLATEERKRALQYIVKYKGDRYLLIFYVLPCLSSLSQCCGAASIKQAKVNIRVRTIYSPVFLFIGKVKNFYRSYHFR